MEVSVYTKDGVDTGRKATLPVSIFGITPNTHAIYLDVKQYLANQRQGTHKAKQRNEVSGTTKKLKKQKGTGGARAGSMKSPVFVGGGRIFGPVPRDYSFKLNKKVKNLARKSALAQKALANKISVIEDFTMETPSTKGYLKVLKNLTFDNTKSLLVLSSMDQNVVLSSRNLQKANVAIANHLNTYELVNSEQLILAENSLNALEAFLN